MKYILDIELHRPISFYLTSYSWSLPSYTTVQWASWAATSQSPVLPARGFSHQSGLLWFIWVSVKAVSWIQCKWPEQERQTLVQFIHGVKANRLLDFLILLIYYGMLSRKWSIEALIEAKSGTVLISAGLYTVVGGHNWQSIIVWSMSSTWFLAPSLRPTTLSERLSKSTRAEYFS